MPSALLMLFPLAWVVGVSFLLPGLAILMLLRRPSRIPAQAQFFFLVPAMLCISLLLSILQFGMSDRSVSAAYNVFVWIGGVSLMVVVQREGTATFLGTARSQLPGRVTFIACFILAAGFAPFVLWIAGILPPDSTLPTLLGLLSEQSLPGILRFYSVIELVRPDFLLNQHTVRFNSIGIYPNEGALLAGGWGLLWLAFRVRSQRGIKHAWIIDLITFLVVLLTASRGSAIAYLMAALLVSIPTLGRSRPSQAANAGLRALLLIVAIGIGLSQSSAFLEVLGDVRFGSSVHRINSYAYAVQLTLDRGLFLGLGVKPFDELAFRFPIGSHSTLISAFTKGGLLTVLAVVTAIFGATKPYLRSVVFGFGVLGERDRAEVRTTKYFARATIFGLLWCLFEDVDAPALGAMTFFSILGLGLCWSRFLASRKTEPAQSGMSIRSHTAKHLAVENRSN